MEKIREIAAIVFKALTLAMGVAVVVLSRLGNLDTQTAGNRPVLRGDRFAVKAVTAVAKSDRLPTIC